ncbi:MAG: aldo/keto reductase [Verrucomicrobiae bacterium]|nr:aldo/keto reductase [Verrucomicrobiae bacterium]
MKTEHRNSMSRRLFLGATTAAAVGLIADAHAAGSRVPAGSMKYRRLGRTNLKVSEIGLGCATGLRSEQLGPELFNRYREELPAIVHKLLELGGNFVATSASYHDTEEILGRALKGRRKDALIFTATSPKREVKKIIADCERSLQRFRTDVIDGYFGHGGWSDAFGEAAQKLKAQGKIRFIGMSCHVPAEHRVQVEAGHVDFILQPYNYLNLAKWTEQTDRIGTEQLFELCKQKDVGVMVIKPMTGHFIPNWGKKTDDPKVAAWLKELKEFGTENLYQAFLLWVLRNPNISCAIVGMGTVQDVIEDCAVVTQKFRAEHKRLLDGYAALATGDYCRMCETCLSVCPVGVRIPDILRFRMYHQNYGHCRDARELYAALPAAQRATACTECRRCEKACPARLAIVQKLKAAHTLLA